MAVTFDSSEVRKLAADLELGRQRVGREASQVVRKAAERVKSSAQAKAPKLTGKLAGSIGVDLYGDGRSSGLTAVIGPTASYGLFVENGTSKMAAEPYMGPAFVEESPAMADELARVAAEGMLG